MSAAAGFSTSVPIFALGGGGFYTDERARRHYEGGGAVVDFPL